MMRDRRGTKEPGLSDSESLSQLHMENRFVFCCSCVIQSAPGLLLSCCRLVSPVGQRCEGDSLAGSAPNNTP